MLVLDYPRTVQADDYSLLISPFHTGHLGFRPETEVSLLLLDAPRRTMAYSELVIGPFNRSSAGIAILTAIMRDEVGVVERLVNAIAELGINIEVEESASIAHLDRHSVRLVLNLEGLGNSGAELLQPVAGPYREYAPYVPLHDRRCRQVFEAVVRNCADILAVRAGAVPTLDLRIDLLPRHEGGKPATATLESARSQNVRVPLPREIVNGIQTARARRSVQVQRPSPATEQLHYLFLSDTDDRSLRVFFLESDAARRIYHVAMRHKDQPHALGTLLSLTAAAKFNILTSLVRRGEAPNVNVWEAVLEYRGEPDDQPTGAAAERSEDWFNEAALPWLRDKLAAGVSDPHEVAEFDISLSQPTYPRKGGVMKPFRLIDPTASEARAPEALAPPRTDVPEEQVAQRRRAIARLAEDRSMRDMRLRLLDRIGQRKELPRVYLAFTHKAQPHAELIRDRLDEACDCVFRVVQGAEMRSRAHDLSTCDFFIGVWRHDETLVHHHHGTFGGSSWLHYLYGAATVSGIPTLIVRSHEADPLIWPEPRTGPEPDHITYSDFEFTSVTLRQVVTYCRDHFDLEIR